MSTTPFALTAVGLVVLSALHLTTMWWVYVMKWKIHNPVFGNQIQKLIMVNNIDHAIKLCNAEYTALFPKVVKAMLLRSNRPYSINFAFHKAQFEVLKGTTSRVKLLSWTFLVDLLAISGLAYGIMEGVEGNEMWTIKWAIIALFVLRGLKQMVISAISAHMVKCTGAGVSIRNMLYSRLGYTPIEERRNLREMTEAEIANWKAGIEYVESKAQGEGPDTATKIHDEMAEDDGTVLGPL